MDKDVIDAAAHALVEPRSTLEARHGAIEFGAVKDPTRKIPSCFIV